MKLSEITSTIKAVIESGDLPAKRFYDGERFNPGKPLSDSGDWLKLEIIAGPTERIGLTSEGLTERRPLAIVELAVPDGYGDERLTDYEDQLYSLFLPGLAINETRLRVRSAGPFSNGRRRDGAWLVVSTSIPFSTYRP